MAGSFFMFSQVPAMAALIAYPDPAVSANRGKWNNSGLTSISIQTLPTDAIGTFNLTMSNLVVGSSIQIEDQGGTTTMHNSISSGTTKVVSLPAYAPGSSLNNLRIKVRKGSSTPFYRPYETLATAFVGSQSIYVSQIPD